MTDRDIELFRAFLKAKTQRRSYFQTELWYVMRPKTWTVI
jgi:hypothetical protein